MFVCEILYLGALLLLTNPLIPVAIVCISRSFALSLSAEKVFMLIRKYRERVDVSEILVSVLYVFYGVS